MKTRTLMFCYTVMSQNFLVSFLPCFMAELELLLRLYAQTPPGMYCELTMKEKYSILWAEF